MKNLKLSMKIVAITSLVIVLMGVGSVFGLYEMNRIEYHLESIVDVNNPTLDLALRTELALARQQVRLDRFLRYAIEKLTNPAAQVELDKAKKEFAEQGKIVEEVINEMRKVAEHGATIANSEEDAKHRLEVVEMLERLHAGDAAFLAAAESVFKLESDGNLAEALRQNAKLIEARAAADRVIEELVTFAKETNASRAKLAKSDQSAALYGVMAAIAIALVISIGVGLLMGRRIAAPLIASVGVLQEIAKGDFARRVEFESKDEIGQLADAINRTAAQLAESQVSMARSQNIVENATTNIMMADKDLKLIYINPASMRMFRSLEHLLPCKADEMLGRSIDIFHKNPAHQRKLLSDPNNLPYHTEIKLGTEHLDLNAAAILDKEGNYLGPMVSWSLITDQKKAKDRDLQVQAQVTGIARELNDNSGNLVSMSNTMAANAEENSAQATNVSAAAEQVSANVSSVAAAVEEMTATIQEVSKTVIKSSEVTQKAVAMSKKASGLVTQLGESSNEISQVTKVIASIAQQTNILALNATIEAARAGEAGKGFAVVANEVKELAKSTSKMTEDISTRIAGIQQSTGEAVTSIEEINRIMTEVDSLSSTVASAVEEQSATTNEISRSMTEASTGVNEIVKNITGMAEAAKDTSKQALSSKEGAESLGQLAQRLQEIVELFAAANAGNGKPGNGGARAVNGGATAGLEMGAITQSAEARPILS